jgi:hypothetical protein
MSRLNYVEIGRTGKYFNTGSKDVIDNLYMYKGFASSFVEVVGGVYLRVDTARKIVRKDTVLSIIDELYRLSNCSTKEEKRNKVKEALIGSIVMTTYAKSTFYRVLDINFGAKVTDFPIDDKYSNLKEYYSKKYGI